MDTQPVVPMSSNPFSTGAGPSSSRSPLLIVLVAVFGLAAAVFAALALVFFVQSTAASKNLESKKAAAVAQAKTDQQKADEQANTIANGLPYRSYVAPNEFGAF